MTPDAAQRGAPAHLDGMSTSNRVPSGVPTGGQFATTSRAEAFGLTLAPSPVADGPNMVHTAVGHAERLVARATTDGKMTPAERVDDIEFDLRQDFPNVSQQAFDEHLATIASLAEKISATEAADATDVDAYADAADQAGHVLDDYPADDWAPGDAYSDCVAFKAGVISELDLQMFCAARDLAEADAAAADQVEPEALSA